MKILVGWWDPTTGQLLDIPSFDYVLDPNGWLPAIVEVRSAQFQFGPPKDVLAPVTPAQKIVPVDVAGTMKRRRLELHLNISVAAKRAGISRTTWHELEKGLRANVRSRTWQDIARALEL